MRGSHPHAPTRTQRSLSIATTIVAVAALILAACDPVASPTANATNGAALAATSPGTSQAAPAFTPGPDRPPGVPVNAQPLLYGCEAGIARCENFAPGTYYTAGTWAFLPGLAFTLPAGWSSLSNEAGELALRPIDQEFREIAFARDLVPWVDGKARLDVGSDPESMIAFLRQDSRLVVSEPERVTLHRIEGSNGRLVDLEAMSVTVVVAPSATTTEAFFADCPGTACVGFMMDPNHWVHPYGLGRDMMDGGAECPCSQFVRLYFASIGYAHHPHTLVVTVGVYGSRDHVSALAEWQSNVQPILDSVVVPFVVVDN